ncbi:MAG: sialate O-acetylesterase [Lentisphaeria bacterium]|nr:sialate O-acetylesterase [Lentisphaeria bacterium]
MRISHGLLPGQVLQRNRNNNGGANVRGVCAADGDVECRILAGDKILSGHDWQVVGQAANRKFEATLSAIPTGGPYRVEWRLGHSTDTAEGVSVADIFVGDVWILAGQSNMEGVGNLKDAPEPHPLVRAFYMRDEWGLAQEKLHFLAEAVDVIHNGYGNGSARPSDESIDGIRKNQVKGCGPGLPFALAMQCRTGIPQGLIACAHGGTSMAQWSPTLRDRGGASLYGAMMRRYEKLGQPVAGVLWYQGESDANAECAAVYTEKMVELIEATRNDMNLPGLPWLIVQLGCHIASGGTYWNSVQDQQRRLPESIERLDAVPAIDLSLDDGIHISGRDQQALGRRLARAADRLVHGNQAALPAIALEKVDIIHMPDTRADNPSKAVTITYKNVAGALVSQGRPSGFALVNADGEEVPGIFKTVLAGDRVTLHTDFSGFQLSRLGVSYGYGRYPYCNITDSEGMSLPVMRAVMIDPDHAPACEKWETVRIPDARTVSDVDPAAIGAAAPWTAAPPRTGFGFLPKPPYDNQTGVFAMRTCVTAATPLAARVTFGANAPFKIWLNGEAIGEDISAGPPLSPDQYTIDIQLIKGENILAVAIALPGPGAHLGIHACIGTPAGKRDPNIELF